MYKKIINKVFESKKIPLTEQRQYLGMSEIGEKCWRKLWYNYHLKREKILDGQLKRIFKMGNIIEEQVIKDIVSSGYLIKDTQRYFSDIDNNFRGHCDGIVYGHDLEEELLIEIKSSSSKNFSIFEKKGVKNHPTYGEKYEAQMQCYLYYSGLSNGLFIVENKDTQKWYCEIIKADNYIAKEYIEKAEKIIKSENPGSGLSKRLDWYECTYCDYNNDQMCKKVENQYIW